MSTSTYTKSESAPVDLIVKSQVTEVAQETNDEPEAKAFYIVTTIAAVVMFLLAIGSVAAMLFFFAIVYQS